MQRMTQVAWRGQGQPAAAERGRENLSRHQYQPDRCRRAPVLQQRLCNFKALLLQQPQQAQCAGLVPAQAGAEQGADVGPLPGRCHHDVAQRIERLGPLGSDPHHLEPLAPVKACIRATAVVFHP